METNVITKKLTLLAFFPFLLLNGQESTEIIDYAVLISGAEPSRVGSYNGGMRTTYDEFWNDTYLMWEIHYKKTGMQDNSNNPGGQIKVLYGNGEDYFNASDRYRASWNRVARVTDYSAYYSDVVNMFTWLKNGNQQQYIPHRMNENEELFCWTFDHGDTATINQVLYSYLCLMDGEMRDDDFASRVNQINAGKRVFWMQQCFSGGFIDDLANNKNIIITACSATQTAWRADDISRNGSPLPENELGNHHGEFNFHIMNAVRGCAIYPYGNPPVVDADVNNDNGVSMYEAFDYTQNHDSRYLLETTMLSDVGNLSNNTFLDYRPPTQPPNLTGYTNSNGVFLDWNPSTETETAIKYYLVKRIPAFTRLTDTLPTTTNFWDWDVRSYTTYTYRIYAIDLELNASPFSSITITTGYVNPPIPASSDPQVAAGQTMENLNFMTINQNPIHKNATISVSIINSGYINLTVYDTQGKQVKNIQDVYKPAGIHNINFDVSSLASGVYFLHLTTDNFSDIQKVIIVQ